MDVKRNVLLLRGQKLSVPIVGSSDTVCETAKRTARVDSDVAIAGMFFIWT